MARQDWVQLIRSLAPQYGVDPQAALAVAAQEGLSGGVGDNGTSFGPFQLHVGGALPQGRGRNWAESQAGIRYAIEQMSKVAKGKMGKAAVASIVAGFERPADPASETRNAVNSLAKFRPGPHGAGTQAVLAKAPAVEELPAAKRNSLLSLFDGPAKRDEYRKGISALGDIQSKSQATKGGQHPGTPSKPVATARGASRPIHGKIIGTPHSGTHTLGNWESDNAVDVAMKVGTPIYAPMAGTIGKQFGSLGKSGRFEGIRMHLLSPQDELYLAHLSKVAKGVGPGAHVTQGQLLGYSGEANGVGHLHLGAKKDDAASYVS